MKSRHQFTQKKFKSLQLDHQHKKCAELLRSAIEKMGDEQRVLLNHYHELCTWMEFEPLHAMDLESLADRYHSHMQLGDQFMKEDSFLAIEPGRDRETPIDPCLDVTVYLDHLRSAHNIGNIVRSAECYGLRRVIFSPDMVGLRSNQVRRSAMGCQSWIEVVEELPLSSCPRPWIALETNPEATSIDNFKFPSTFTLIVGNEEYGCSTQTLDHCDHYVRIPMHGRKNSLNVAAAFATAAYEIRRQVRGPVQGT